ncbi:hypothetical protein HK105_203507 [Polyrhizophydium stewartii]|uniref:Calponin-homology (CH) domain-containing protein n=1 Tax=Polyrhizophydium stewartii TaxID=2732419 RepID=A0ABR4NC05_9FUNG
MTPLDSLPHGPRRPIQLEPVQPHEPPHILSDDGPAAIERVSTGGPGPGPGGAHGTKKLPPMPMLAPMPHLAQPPSLHHPVAALDDDELLAGPSVVTGAKHKGDSEDAAAPAATAPEPQTTEAAVVDAPADRVVEDDGAAEAAAVPAVQEETDASAEDVKVPEAAPLPEPEATPQPEPDVDSIADVEELRRLVKQRDARIKQLEELVAARDHDLATLRSESETAAQLAVLQARNAELEDLVKTLKQASSITKSRINPRTGKRPTSAAESDATAGDAAAAGDAGSASGAAPETAAAGTSESPETETPAAQPEESPQEALRKKIMGMGGMNPLVPMGFKPGAVKLRSSSGNGLADAAGGPEVNEAELRQWLFEKIGDDDLLPDSGTSLKEALRDGKLLCKLGNAVSGKDPVKINMGHFPAMHKENIAKFIAIAEAMGVPRQRLFEVSDLYDGADVPRVMQTLDALRRIVEVK